MPRFGELQATDVWAAATRTLSAFAAQDLFDLPNVTTLYPTVAATSSAVADAFGDWVQLVANVGAGKRLIWAWVLPRFEDTLNWEVELGAGAAPNEARITAVTGKVVPASSVGHRPAYIVYVWRSLADNARLSARARNDGGAARVYDIAVGYA